MFGHSENGDSPVYIACTQETSNDLDVVWDWNSPQAKQQPKRIHRRPVSTRSPKIPLKRHPSNNQIQNFDKLREELKNLKEAISVPEHEESLILSPIQEREYKDINNFENGDDMLLENFLTEDNLFDDSVDEKLVLFSQKVEAELCNTGQVKNQLFCGNNKFSDVKEQAIIKTSPTKQEIMSNVLKSDNVAFSSTKSKECDNQIPDDSFDTALEMFSSEPSPQHKESFMEIFNKTITKEDIKNKHTFSQANLVKQTKITRQTTGKIEFHRTESFESTLGHINEKIPQAKLEEMERKRREALAKLESKRKTQEGSDTPTKCTPQEIEQKRLQALAKREAKQQEIIERKRKDALKRLELSRKKNATIIKSSLTKRL